MKKWHLLLGGLLAMAMLAGCGSDESGAAGESAAAGAAAQTEQAQTADGGGQARQGGPGGGFGMTDENGNAADLIGKIKSVSGNTITVYKSQIDPSQTGGGRGGMRSGGSEGQDGAARPPSGDAETSNGAAPSPGGDGSAQPGDGGSGRPPGGVSMDEMFTEETVDITVTDATVIRQTSFENNEMTTTDAALADLKEGDVLTIWLAEGTQEASSIRLGAFGGGMGGGGGPGQP
ncbi:hypothetical protein [Cohnella algarum]|uniref:hypothetical protein n=1 Tax=Cohnella algarum TaxID=2044859 RepID=UPI00196728F2|nr:hypothetical protein [Cohnella algarum]MBN2984531.1 hypothetical protein [Cohnella algarum]